MEAGRTPISSSAAATPSSRRVPPSEPHLLDANRAKNLWFAIYDYEAQTDDELDLQKVK